MDKVKLAIGGVLILVILAATVQIQSGLFSLLSGHAPEKAQWSDILILWRDHSADPVIYPKLLLATAIPFIVTVIATTFLFVSKKQDHLFGDARFARESEIRAMGLRAENGVILGKKGGKFLISDAQMGVILFAPPRSGKGTGFVIPNLLNWNDSAIITDIKFENWDITAKFRSDHGQKVFLFAPLAKNRKGHCYNPLDFVSQDADIRIKDVQKIAAIILPHPAKGDPVWVNEARDLLEGLILFVMDTDHQATFAEILWMIKGTDNIEVFLMGSLDQYRSILDPVCIMAFNGFLQKADKERSGVLSEVKSGLSLWKNPIVVEGTSKSDFNPAMLRRERMSIYVGVSPDDLGIAMPLLNLFIQQVFDALLKELPGKDEPYRVLALLDEFTALGRLDNIERGLGYFAGYNITLAPIIQEHPLLERLYGREGAKGFLSTARYRIAYAQNNDETALYISRQMGKKTLTVRNVSHSYDGIGAVGKRSVSKSLTGVPLMLPQDIMKLPKGKEIILVEGCRPVLANKIVWFKDKALKGRANG